MAQFKVNDPVRVTCNLRSRSFVGCVGRVAWITPGGTLHVNLEISGSYAGGYWFDAAELELLTDADRALLRLADM